MRTVGGVELRRVDLGGVPCDLVDRDEAERLIRDAMLDATGPPVLVASANLDKVFHFGHGRPDEGFFDRSARREDWVVLLDGAPLARQAKRIAPGSWPRLTGADLLPTVLDLASGTGARVGFLGGNDEGHVVLTDVVAERWPGVVVSGTWAPERAEVDWGSAAIAAAVRAAGTDVLVVALTPRSEAWLDQWAGGGAVHDRRTPSRPRGRPAGRPRVGLAPGLGAEAARPALPGRGPAGVLDPAPPFERVSAQPRLCRIRTISDLSVASITARSSATDQFSM
jgi:UDP-N-acetyl-D-mannosaminuronic acid transferase (WecB/TagA/CpsF family)